MKIIETIGDGSCLLHALFTLISRKYVDMTTEEKMKFVRRIRTAISNEITEEEFNLLGNGHLKEVITLQQWKELVDSTSCLGEEVLEYLTHVFRVNINMWWKDPIEKYPLHFPFFHEYYDVHIFWTGNHYNAIKW